MTLFDLIEKREDGLDVCDKDWDFGIYFDFSKEEDSNNKIDWYNKCMIEIAKRTIVDQIHTDYYTSCDFSQMILDNLTIFKKFFNEENTEGYRPMDYEKADDSSIDEGFYEAYLAGLESLIAGNYSDSDYKKLYELLIEKEK